MHLLFLCNNKLLQYLALHSDNFVLANILPENLYCFSVTINCKSLIKLTVLPFLHVYFVLDYHPNRLSVALVYFCSRQQITRSYILFLYNNKILLVIQFYCYVRCPCIFLFSTIIQTFSQLCLYILFPNNKLPDHIYCFCVTIKC